MNTYFGQMLTLSLFGQSHSKAIGMTLEGLPAGEKLDIEKLKRFLLRRAPGNNAWSTARHEADEPDFVGGLVDGGESRHARSVSKARLARRSGECRSDRARKTARQMIEAAISRSTSDTSRRNVRCRHSAASMA